MGVVIRFVRHGATDWTDEKRYTGLADVALNPDGIRQIEAMNLPAVRYASTWTSDLERCVSTAALLGIEATATPQLREFDFGEIEGRRWDDLSATDQAALLAYDDFEAPGGESVVAFGRRVESFIAALGPGTHLAVTHGGVIHHVLRQHGIERHIAPGEWIDVELG